MLNRDSILTGIAVGFLLPFLSYWLIKSFFDLFTYWEIFDPSGFSESWRLRTTTLLAICTNIIPFNLYRRRRNDESMRGLIFPTVLYVGVWVYFFQGAILGAV